MRIFECSFFAVLAQASASVYKKSDSIGGEFNPGFEIEEGLFGGVRDDSPTSVADSEITEGSSSPRVLPVIVASDENCDEALDEQQESVIRVKRTKPARQSPRVTFSDAPPTVYTIPRRSIPTKPSEETILAARESIHALFGALKDDDSRRIRPATIRPPNMRAISQEVTDALAANRPDLLEKLAEAATETREAYEVDKALKMQRVKKVPLPRMAALVKAIDTLYARSVNEDRLNFKKIEEAILGQEWDGPILI